MNNSNSAKQQANTPGLQNVKNEGSGNPKKQGLSSAAKLQRTTFRTSREMDFFNEKELVTQTGHEIQEWPLVFLKETLDNALDACEEAGIPPKIQITADEEGITVADNGPGLPTETLQGALDFSIRASSREAYVAPDRGAQGNALKTLLPMANVIDPKTGKLIIEASGQRHELTCGCDPISQQAIINDASIAMPTQGTMIRIQWSPHGNDGLPEWPFDHLLPTEESNYSSFAQQFESLVAGFALFNPHATIELNWFGSTTTWQATDVDWPKWTPDMPTSSHWYGQEHLERLIGAYITHGNEAGVNRLVSDFLKEFDGLSGSQKRAKVLADTDLQRQFLSSLVIDNQLDSPTIAALLAAMQRYTRVIKPRRLGVIGEAHFRERLLAMGVEPDSFRYTKKFGKGAVPWVLESAFGYLGEDSEAARKIFAGANWSAAIKNPYRSFGQTGEGLETILADMRAGRNEPIVFALHLASPRLQYTDRGKSALVIGGEQ